MTDINIAERESIDSGKARQAPHADSKSVHTVRQPISIQPHFNRQVTINPELVDTAWINLSLNTRAVEYHEFPSKLHENFLNALKKRIHLIVNHG